MFSIFTAILLFLTASGLLVIALIGRMFSWSGAGLVALLYTKSTLSLVFFLRKRSTIRLPMLLAAREWRMLAIGYLISVGLFLVSGLVGEGWLGFAAAIVLTFTGSVFFFVSNRAQRAEAAAGDQG